MARPHDPRFSIRPSWLVLLAALLLTATPSAAITIGQVDDFEDETQMNWSYAAAANLTVPTTGGPDGAGDAFLQLTTDGVSNPGGRPVVTNPSQWSGDYVAAGVTGISADFMNDGGEVLEIRIAFEGVGGAQYASMEAIELPADGQWYTFFFDLTDASAFTEVTAGTETDFADVLDDVNRLRFLSAETPAWNGDLIVTVLGVDNVTAVPEPGVLALVGLGLLGLSAAGRRHARQE